MSGAATGAVGLMAARAAGALTSSSSSAIRPSPNLCRHNCALNGVRARVRSPTSSTGIAGGGRPRPGKRRPRPDKPALPGGGHGPGFRPIPAGRCPCAAGRRAGGVARRLRGPAPAEGALVLIQRADRLGGLPCGAVGPARRGRSGFVHPQADQPAIRFVLAARKGAARRWRSRRLSSCNDAEGRFTPRRRRCTGARRSSNEDGRPRAPASSRARTIGLAADADRPLDPAPAVPGPLHADEAASGRAKTGRYARRRPCLRSRRR